MKLTANAGTAHPSPQRTPTRALAPRSSRPNALNARYRTIAPLRECRSLLSSSSSRCQYQRLRSQAALGPSPAGMVCRRRSAFEYEHDRISLHLLRDLHDAAIQDQIEEAGRRSGQAPRGWSVDGDRPSNTSTIVSPFTFFGIFTTQQYRTKSKKPDDARAKPRGDGL